MIRRFLDYIKPSAYEEAARKPSVEVRGGTIGSGGQFVWWKCSRCEHSARAERVGLTWHTLRRCTRRCGSQRKLRHLGDRHFQSHPVRGGDGRISVYCKARPLWVVGLVALTGGAAQSGAKTGRKRPGRSPAERGLVFSQREKTTFDRHF